MKPTGTTYAEYPVTSGTSDMRLAYENASRGSKPTVVYFADTPSSRAILKHYGIPIPKAWKKRKP